MDEKIEKAIKPLLKMYEKIENDLLIQIASHFSINEEFLNSDYWRIKKLEEMGLFNQEVINYISRYSGKTDKEIKKALNRISIDTINMDKLNRLFEDEVLKINPNILINNYVIENIINTAYNELSNRFIEMSSKIEKSAREAYLNIIEEAYLKTSMGTHSYQETIRETINELSNKGINTLTYKTIDENGNIVGIRNYDIEGAIRRETLTASRQLSNNISMEVANELNSEYVYLSEHLQCRPQHFDWQGTIIKRDDLVKITDYGSITGLGGINCRHYFEAYFGDARGSDLKSFNKEDCNEAYKLSQHQRYLERGIRKWKRKAEMFKVSDDKEYYSKCKEKVREWQIRNKQFTEDNNLKRDYTREHVYQKYPNWYAKLNKEEKYAIENYISSDSYVINDSLRNDYPMDDRLQSVSNNLSLALNKIPNSKGIYNRSLFFDDNNLKQQFVNSMNNDVVTFKSFTSMSKEIYDNNDDIRLIIHCKTAKDLSKINANENEILLDKGKSFKKLKRWRENDKIFYEMEEL